MAPEGDLAVGGALQADECLPAKQAAALLQGAIVAADAAFQHKDTAHAAAEILHAAQTPTRTRQAFAVQRVSIGRAAARALEVGIDLKVGVQRTVQRDGGLSMCRACEGTKCCQCDNRRRAPVACHIARHSVFLLTALFHDDGTILAQRIMPECIHQQSPCLSVAWRPHARTSAAHSF
ncbi:hypothetical protein D3C72_1790730 [compost metagenome]